MLEPWSKALGAGLGFGRWMLVALVAMAWALPAAGQLRILEFAAEEDSANGRVEVGESMRMRMAVDNVGGPPEGRTARLEVGFPEGFGAFQAIGGNPPDTLEASATGFVATWSLLPDRQATFVFRITAPECFPSGATEVQQLARLYQGPIEADTRTANPLPITGAGVVDLGITQAATSSTTAPGEVVPWDLLVENHSLTHRARVVVRDTTPVHSSFDSASPEFEGCGGETCSTGVLDLGCDGSANLTYAARVDDALPAGVEEICNLAEVLYDGAVHAEDTLCVGIDPSSLFVDLMAFKHTDSDPPGPGGPVSFTLVARNAGTTTAPSATFEETVPAGSLFDAGASSPGWSCEHGSLPDTPCLLDAGPLHGAGTELRRTFAVRVLDPLPGGIERIVNRATVLPLDQDPTPANNTAEAEIPIVLGPGDGPNLRVIKTADRETVGAGEPIRWTVTIDNTGNVGAGPVLVEDTVPEHTKIVEGSSPEWLGCPPGTTAETLCRIELDGLEVGAPRTFELVGQVISPLPAGVEAITNSAVGRTDGDVDPTDDQATVSVPVTVGDGHGPDVALDLSTDVEEIGEGERLTFTLTAGSGGDQGADGVSLSADIPPWTRVRSDLNPGWICDEHSCVLEVGLLEVGATIEADLIVEVLSDLPPEAEEIAGRAVVSAAVDVEPSNDQATLSVPIREPDDPPGPDLRVSLEGTEQVAPGVAGQDRAFYAVTVVHQSGDVAPGVVIETVVPTDVILESFELDGESAETHCDSMEMGLVCRLPPRNMAAGDTSEVELQVRFPAEAPDGTVVVEASAFPSPPDLEVTPVDNRDATTTRVSNEPGDPSPVDVPAASTFGLITLASLLGAVAAGRLRRRRV